MSILLDKLYIPCRYEVLENGSITWCWPAGYCKFQAKTTQIKFRISGKGTKVRITMDEDSQDIDIMNDEPVVWTSPLLEDSIHKVRIQTLHTDILYPFYLHEIHFKGAWCPIEMASQLIEFVGDSWTVGYGNLNADRPEGDCTKAWAAQLANLSQAEYRLVAASGHGIAKNYGERPLQSPNLTDKYQWISPIKESIVAHSIKANQVFVLAGENDFSEKPWPDFSLFQKRATHLIKAIQEHNPNADILIVCVERNLPAYELWLDLAKTHGLKTIRLPNLDSTIALGHQWHPSFEHHQQIAQMVFEQLQSS